MLNSLDLLVIVSAALTALSLLSLALMFLMKSPLVKRIALYIVSAIGVYAAYVGIRIGGDLFPVQVAVGVAVALVSIGAIVLERMSKGDEKKFNLARILAAAGLVVGLLNALL